MIAQDQHPEETKAAIRMRGTTLCELSLLAGYNETAVRKALRQPWPAVERIIAEFLGVEPQTIWPSRYLPDGTSKVRTRGRKPNQTRRERKDVENGAAR